MSPDHRRFGSFYAGGGASTSPSRFGPRGWIATGVLLAAVLSGVAAWTTTAHAAFGVEPGSFVGKTHPTVPLEELPGEPTEYLGREIALAQIVAEAPVTQAGAHPDATASFTLNHTGSRQSALLDGVIKDASVATPPGFLGNPNAVPACSRDAFQRTFRDSTEELPLPDGCSPASQVGVATIHQGSGFQARFTTAVYRIATAAGTPASFGFPAFGNGIILNPKLRSDSDYGLTLSAIDIDNEPYPILDTTVTLWGVPASPVHDSERFNTETQTWGTQASSAQEVKPFLSNPTYCDSGPLTTSISVDSWNEVGHWLPTDAGDPDYLAQAPQPTGCAQLAFGGPGAEASLTLQPVSHAADTPSEYRAKVRLPYDESPAGLSSPALRDTTVTLPEGVVANASSANGLAACTTQQIGYLGSGFPMPNPVRFDEEEPHCPDASKIGSVTIDTPLLEKPLEGSVYLAKQGDNPFGSLLAIYLAVDDAETGIVIKLAGKVTPDPQTGRLTATFTDNPELPFTELDLSFFGGAGAVLANPSTCGTKTTSSVLTPWSAPYTPAVTSTDSFQLISGPAGASCAPTEAQLPNHPGFEAGTVSPLAATYGPLVLKLSREDGTQRIASVDATLPPGLLGKLAGIPYCSDASVAAASARSGPGEGALEQGGPSCPVASQIGTVDIAAGAGTQPVHVQGKAYLAGPYKGAPLSMAIITPAVAGPFDLGTVVVRTALFVDETSTQIHAVSDPIPSILEGIPLDVRSIALSLDRSDFTLNPTSCDPTSVSGSATSTLGNVATLSNRFQVGGCKGLDFMPKLALRVFGKTNRNAKPRFRAVLQAKPGEANIARAQVNLPHSEFLEQAHIKTVCTRVQWSAGGGHGEQCPRGSIYGHARAFTPLLEKPIEGPVYLRSSSHKLPDLVAALNGQIDVALAAKVDSGPNNGIRNTFEVVPDAPVSKFILELKGGKKGLLVNSENLCANGAKTTGLAHFVGQNGEVENFKPKVANGCSKAKKH